LKIIFASHAYLSMIGMTCLIGIAFLASKAFWKLSFAILVASFAEQYIIGGVLPHICAQLIDIVFFKIQLHNKIKIYDIFLLISI